MTAQQIIELIRKNFPNASEVVLEEIASRLKEHEDYVFQRVHKQAYEGGKDVGYRLGFADGEHKERMNHLGWSND